MKQCIEKSVIVEEINRLIKSPILYKSENVETRINVLEYLLSFIDTLEVTEIGVDLGDPKVDKSAIHIIDTKTLKVKEVDLESLVRQLKEK